MRNTKHNQRNTHRTPSQHFLPAESGGLDHVPIPIQGRFGRVLLLLTLLAGFPAVQAAPVGSAFSYQGRLETAGAPVSGDFDLTFSLYDAATDGNLLATQELAGVIVEDGLLSVVLDFGDGVFSGNARWLELGVRTNGAPDFDVLAPRQPVLPTPQSTYASEAGVAAASSSLLGILPDAQLSANIPRLDGNQTFTGVVRLDNEANDFSGNGAGLTNVSLETLNSAGAISFSPLTFAPYTSVYNLGMPLELSLRAGDLTGDGWPDLVTLSPAAARFVVLTNRGDGTFSVATNAYDSRDYRIMKMADTDGDGDLDLVGAGVSNLGIYTNIGSGVFRFAMQLNGNYSVETCDLNGDGRVDILANVGGAGLIAYTNRGDNLFNQTFYAALPVSSSPEDIIAADINGDALPDCLMVDYNNSRLMYYRNLGNGTFVSSPVQFSLPSPWALAASDLNLDGHTDVVVASRSGYLFIYTNNAAGMLTQIAPLNVGSDTTSVSASDLDMDGYPDLVCTRNNTASLAIWVNDGHGHFTAAASPAVRGTPLSVVAADLNRDGRPDLAAAHYSSQDIVVLFGKSQANFAGTFVGDGSELTALDAGNLSSGTVADARLSGNVALLNAHQTFTGNNTFSGLIAGNGDGLTNLNADALAAGTVSDARLGANVARLDGSVVFQGSVTARDSLAGARLMVGTNHVLVPSFSTIAGGSQNRILDGSLFGTISGGNNHLIDSNSWFCTVSGGAGNLIGQDGGDSTIAGGYQNQIGAQVEGGTIGGGSYNEIGESSLGSTIAGGYHVVIEDSATTATAGGGMDNTIKSGASYATLGGGTLNTISTNAQYSTIVGGGGNFIYDNAYFATIAGGANNAAAGFLSFAAGSRAKALHTGSFVWADSQNEDLVSPAQDSVTFRATGGATFYTSTNQIAGVTLAPGATAWASVSDRNTKKDFAPVDGVEVLEKLAQVPVQQWRYLWEDAGSVPHLGPMAQDFKAAFYPGRDDKAITTLEMDGVALAAIQGLNQKLAEKDTEISELKARLERLEALLERQSDTPQND